ncbi:MAG: endopeptidase La [Chloroflexi bacterium]|nr:endopeptidase La [Chloroflexota bacterium]
MEDLDFEMDDPESSPDGIIEGPLLPLRDMVVFPRMVTPLFVGRDRSLAAVEAAQQRGENLIAVAQRDAELDDVGPEDVFTVGTEMMIGRTLRMPDGTASVMGQGTRRVQVVEYVHLEPYIRVRALPIPEPTERAPLTEALMRAVLALFEKVVQLNRGLPDETYVFAMNVDRPGWLADLVAQALDLETEGRQEILETIDPATRLQRISVLLAKELDVLELEDQIHSQVQQELDRTQREYFLREQMKVIQSELGENDVYTQETNELREKVSSLELPDEVRKRAAKEFERLASMSPMSPEVGIVRTYLDWLIDLPWSKMTEDNLDIHHVEEVLESRHYGLPQAKDRILEYIAVRRLAEEKMRSPILCFVGPPGTGKTSLGQSIAAALGREFVRVSLGGVRDEAEIRGHRRTYIGALPGRIIQTMRRAGTINPVFMLDEIDKVGMDFRGDPSAALLEVLDPEQNFAFSDHYLEVAYDLSKVLFITTANMLDPIPPALQDRMEVIEFPGYIDEEKVGIARQFLIPRELEEHGLKGYSIEFSDGALNALITEYTFEAGVRNLERKIATICRKIARQVAEGQLPPRRITAQMLARRLGPPEFIPGRAEEEDSIGVATGVAWTQAGGELLPVEVALLPGKGNLMLTGQLGEVMQESAQAALSYTRSRSDDFDIQPDLFDSVDIHIHLPEGAIPKDGPSAGITLATALVSAVTGRMVRHDVGMTGEITLRGRVLPVGGLKEKVLAAHRAGIKTIIIPRKNKKDLADIPKRIRRGIRNIVLVDYMDEVLDVALAPVEAPVPQHPSRCRAAQQHGEVRSGE